MCALRCEAVTRRTRWGAQQGGGRRTEGWLARLASGSGAWESEAGRAAGRVPADARTLSRAKGRRARGQVFSFTIGRRYYIAAVSLCPFVLAAPASRVLCLESSAAGTGTQARRQRRLAVFPLVIVAGFRARGGLTTACPACLLRDDGRAHCTRGREKKSDRTSGAYAYVCMHVYACIYTHALPPSAHPADAPAVCHAFAAQAARESARETTAAAATQPPPFLRSPSWCVGSSSFERSIADKQRPHPRPPKPW